MTGALINHLWQSTLFCAAVWLISLAMRANGAALRHWLWLAASLKFLVPFSALYYLGTLLVPLPAGAQPTLFAQAVEVTAPVVSPPILISNETGSATHWGTVLALVWIAGALVVALRWFHSWRAADSIVRAARPVPGSPLDARVTDAAIEPAVARVFHPVVLLPSALLGRLTAEQLAAVLAHEREHIERHDNFTAHLHRLVQALFWFHPLVWWIGRQMLEERENACDEAVLEHGHDAEKYAEGILAVCRHCHELSHAGHTSSAISGDLTRRIRSIIRHVPPVSPGFCKAFALSACTMALGLGPLFAGALDDAARRRAQIDVDARHLDDADIVIGPAAARSGRGYDLTADDRLVIIRNTTLRELVAVSYGVKKSNVNGGIWLDTSRYDIRVELHDPVADADDFDPTALRGVVNKLLASRFDLQIQIRQPQPSVYGAP
ncbi:MAG TPA: M56 family metallopeptidase [Steroidobacteraceae bacterium]|nr:M56 family metallopeptidase [Steroidobacteraceae bacterium]